MVADVGISLMPMFAVPGPPTVWRVELSSPDPGNGELFESLMFEPVNKFYTATQVKGQELALRRRLTQMVSTHACARVLSAANVGVVAAAVTTLFEVASSFCSRLGA